MVPATRPSSTATRRPAVPSCHVQYSGRCPTMEREESHIVREEAGPGPVEPGGRTIRDESYVREPAASAETEVVSRWSPSRQAYDLVYLVFAVIDGLILIR